MSAIEILTLTPDNYRRFAICGYKNPKRPGYLEKTQWILEQMQHGLRVMMIQSEKDGTQGMIEYIPGAYCWRPVDAKTYMVIHCLFVGFKKAYKGKGYASKLIARCEQDAKQNNMDGVAVVTRKSSFMVGEEIFQKHGYTVTDQAKPDFSLLAKPFRSKTILPKFKSHLEKPAQAFSQGLVVVRADQCPYTVTNVQEILDAAKKEFHLTPKVVNLKTSQDAQNSPAPFGTFCILYNGAVIAHHPISAGRFKNIMRELKS